MNAERNVQALLENRESSVNATKVRMDEALDRFEHGRLIKLPEGSKLTLRSLSVEAGVSKDTPLSKFREGHPQVGQYRFPTVVKRFRELKKRGNKDDPENLKDKKIRELRDALAQSNREKQQLAEVNNELDAENYELRRRNKELEEQNAGLRREAFKPVKAKRR
jgi:hypothetical protein